MKDINIVTGIVSANNLIEDLIILGQFDNDANGNNGIEYTSNAAIENGYNTDLEYWANISNNLFEETRKDDKLLIAIESFINNIRESWNNCCDYFNYEINKDITNDGYLVTIAYI